MSITIQEISGTRGLKKFAKFPINLYKGNEYYVPALVLDEVGTLNSKNNPAFDFCESVYYMAYKDGEPVGRIAVVSTTKRMKSPGKKPDASDLSISSTTKKSAKRFSMPSKSGQNQKA